MTARKHWNAPLEAHVRIRYPSKERLDEFVHALTGLARQRREGIPGASKMPPQTGSIPEESSRTERNR